MRLIAACAVGASFVCLCVTDAAAGTASRVWVSGHGVDQVGCGAPTSPCRSLQYAHDNIVAAGGEIDILDPAGYGAIHITKSVSIVNDGVGTAGVQASSGNAITIAAGDADSVYLRGLNIDGQRGAASNGIAFQSGGNLTVVACVVRHFSGFGIQLASTSVSSQVLISDTNSSENSEGIDSSGTSTLRALIQRTTVAGNSSLGFSVSSVGGGSEDFTIVGSSFSNNGSNGVFIGDPGANPVSMELESDTISGNGFNGLAVDGKAIARLSRSVITHNANVGVASFTISPGGIFSYGSNLIQDNAVANGGGIAATYN